MYNFRYAGRLYTVMHAHSIYRHTFSFGAEPTMTEDAQFSTDMKYMKRNYCGVYFYVQLVLYDGVQGVASCIRVPTALMTS